MHHRHLLPNEIDLLVDQETGFGVQPLRDHVAGCDSCRARLHEAQAVVSALGELPLLAPRFGLADRVMSRVPVFVPWHVAARDSVARLVPRQPALRAVAAVLIASVGALLTGMMLWVATRGDILSMATGLVGEQARATIADAIGNIVVALFGAQVIEAVQQVGPLGIGLAAGGFVIASLGTVLGLRSIATSSRAGR